MESCKINNLTQIPDVLKDRIEGLAKSISDLTKEQLRSEMPDIPKEAIDDHYESHICKSICVKSKSEYEKFRAKGIDPTESTRMAIINELISLRDKGSFADDIAMENIIRNIKNGNLSPHSKNYSRNLNKAYQRFRNAAGEIGYHKTITWSCHNEKLGEYYLGIIAKFNMGIGPFVKESMDFYIENHQEELREIERRENDKAKEEEDKKESVSEKNRRLFG